MAANFPTVLWGVTAPQFRHPSEPRSNLTINSKEDDKPVLINSRDYAQATGDSIGFQSKPNQAVTTTGSVQGFQIQPRYADAVGGGDLIGGNITATLKGTTGNLSGAVHCLEIQTDFNGANTPTRTLTGDLSMLYFFADLSSSMTYSGKKHVITIAQNNTGSFDYFLNIVSAHSDIIGPTTGATAGGTLKCRVNGVDKFIQLLNSAS